MSRQHRSGAAAARLVRRTQLRARRLGRNALRLLIVVDRGPITVPDAARAAGLHEAAGWHAAAELLEADRIAVDGAWLRPLRRPRPPAGTEAR